LAQVFWLSARDTYFLGRPLLFSLALQEPSAAMMHGVPPQLPFLRPAYHRQQTEPWNLGHCTPMGAYTPPAYHTPAARFGGDSTPTFAGQNAPRAPQTPVNEASTPARRDLRRAKTWFENAASDMRRAASRSCSQKAVHSRVTTPSAGQRVRAGTDWVADKFSDAVSGGGGDKPRRILCYGDSLTAGFYNGGTAFEPYGQTLSRELSAWGGQCDVAVCGLSGKTATECVQGMNAPWITDITGRGGKGIDRILTEEGPFDLVIIMLGTNDLGQGQSPDMILNSISKMHSACHRYNIPTIAVAPPTVDYGQTRAVRQQLAQVLATWTHATAGVVAFIDCEDLCPRHERRLWEPDQLHLSPAGSQALGRRMARWVEKMSRSNALQMR